MVPVQYRVREFARLAGVTVKALHHYDRLGLLKPRRTDAGYRIYDERDLERLEQIVALRFLGLPPKQILILLERDAFNLPEALLPAIRRMKPPGSRPALIHRKIRALPMERLSVFVINAMKHTFEL